MQLEGLKALLQRMLVEAPVHANIRTLNFITRASSYGKSSNLKGFGGKPVVFEERVPSTSQHPIGEGRRTKS